MKKINDDTKDIIIAMIFFIGLFFIAIPSVVIAVSKIECKRYAEFANIKTKYTAITGCLVAYNGKTMTLDQFKMIQIPNAVYGAAEQTIKLKIDN